MTDKRDTDALRERAVRVLAGGVLHHLTAFPERPLTIMARGKGSHVWDSTGREYIDYYLGSASLVLGHANPDVTDAVRRQLDDGTHFFEVTPAVIDLAELITEVVPSAERVKFAMSGTDAVAAAVRLVRARSGKSHIVKFEGAYHGSHDWMLWATRHRSALTYPVADADSPGIPNELQRLVLVVPYNNSEAFVALVNRHKHEIAAVIAEPLLGSIKPEPGFLETVRAHTLALDIPLIFDEIVTGFRLALGGAQQHYGVVPDLTALGKSLGGGYPIGALAGRADLMDHFSYDHVKAGTAISHVGTYSGNPVSCTAGAATIRLLQRPGVYERLHGVAAMLADGLRDISQRLGIATVVNNVGPMVDLWFTDRPVSDYPATWNADTDTARRFKLGLIDRGIWSPPGLKMFLSLAHSDRDIEQTLEAAEASMRAL